MADRQALARALMGEREQPMGSFGTGSPTETAQQPSGLGMLASGAYDYLGNLAKRAMGNSAQAVQGGAYNPAPSLEAAMLSMGTGAIAGVPLRGTETVLGSGLVRPNMKPPSELYHVAGPEYSAGEPLKSLYARKGPAAYDEYAARWPEAGDLVQYHPHQNFFYHTMEDAQNHAADFGGKILKIDSSKVDGLHFDKNEGFWTTREDVHPEAFLK